MSALSIIALAIGIAAAVIASALFIGRDPAWRLRWQDRASNAAAVFVLAAVVIRDPLSMTTVKAILIVAVIVLSGRSVSDAITATGDLGAP